MLLYVKRKLVFCPNGGFDVLLCSEPRSIDEECRSLPKVMTSLATLEMRLELRSVYPYSPVTVPPISHEEVLKISQFSTRNSCMLFLSPC